MTKEEWIKRGNAEADWPGDRPANRPTCKHGIGANSACVQCDKPKQIFSYSVLLQNKIDDLTVENAHFQARVKELEDALKESITERAVYRIDAKHPHSAQMLKHAELLESRYNSTARVTKGDE